jgi:hypothetical protein
MDEMTDDGRRGILNLGGRPRVHWIGHADTRLERVTPLDQLMNPWRLDDAVSLYITFFQRRVDIFGRETDNPLKI